MHLESYSFGTFGLKYFTLDSISVNSNQIVFARPINNQVNKLFFVAGKQSIKRLYKEEIVHQTWNKPTKNKIQINRF